MEHPICFLSKHLSGHEIAFKARPDGKLLMSLSQNGKSVYVKAIDPSILMREYELRLIINEVNLNRKIADGDICKEDIGQQLLKNTLPTFSGGPINPTAAKMIWKTRRRII